MSCELKLYGMFINNYVFPPNKTSGESLDEAKFMECLLNNYVFPPNKTYGESL